MRALAATLFVSLFIPSIVEAQRPLEIHALVGLRRVTQVSLSPDGLTIVYLLQRPRGAEEKDGPARAEIHVVSSSGGARRLLVDGWDSLRSLAWHADGSRVVFLGRPAGEKQTALWAVAPSGGKPEKLLQVGLSLRAFSLSGDGTRVAFTATAARRAALVELQKKGFDQTIYEEDLAPVDLHVATFDGKAPVRLDVGGSVHEIQLAPDGRSVFFTMAPTPLIDDRYMARDLYRVDLDGQKKKPVLVADVPGKFGTFSISPDSKRVAYIAGRDINDPHESSLYVVGRDGGWATALTPGDFEGEVHRVAWIDDLTLLCVGTEGCHRTLFTQPAAGGNRKIVMGANSLIPAGISYHRESERLAFTANHRVHPDEVYLMEMRDAKPRRLTDSNPELRNVKWGHQEVVRYRARDGIEVEGVLIHPAGLKKGQRAPLIVVAHGGPESCVLNGWVTRYANPGQVAAGRGYAVFHPNYRSSTGRGVAFSKMGQGDAGGAEFDDVLDGIDHLVELGIADKRKVGITGGSYGGYFTAWAATRHSERFAAAVMFVGISNHVSKIGTTDIADEAYHSHWKKRPWDLVPLLLERSPITYSGNARTPLLIMHGKDDPRVSYTQSLELYRWVKLRTKTPVRLVLYKKEGHGNRRRASQLDYGLRSMRWFDHFLRQGGTAKPPTRIDYKPHE